MTVRAAVAATLVALFLASASAQKTPSFQNIDLVDLDVVVTDREGRAVTGLKKEDFDVREDGKPVELTTFIPVAASKAAGDDAARSMVILLDDVTMPLSSVDAVRAIATYLALQAGPLDDLSVIRFRNIDDEPFGDRRAALARISEYRGAPARFAPAGSPDDVLNLVASVSRKLESTGRRRKILVCIGAPRICNVTKPRIGTGWYYGAWIDAIGATARANLSVYAILAVRASVSGEGLVEATGGAVFGGVSDFRPVLDRIWQDAGHHYLLGYWPGPSSKERHTIGVKVARKDVRVLARRQRGN